MNPVVVDVYLTGASHVGCGSVPEFVRSLGRARSHGPLRTTQGIASGSGMQATGSVTIRDPAVLRRAHRNGLGLDG